MTGIIDYGCGNLFSLISSLEKIGERAEVISDKSLQSGCDRVILPGVGAFGNAVQKLKNSGMEEVVKTLAADGMPLLGICLGMQLLFEKSYEYGEHNGLSLLQGQVKPLYEDIPQLKIPHMGWNSLHFTRQSKLFKYVEEGEYVYFVHSFHAKQCADILATSVYGKEICAAVGRQNVYGVQFHPEKSGDTGLRILKGFVEL